MTACTELEATIAQLSPELQIRVNVIAEAIRGFLACDVCMETELAMHLVITELDEDDTAADQIEADINRKEH